MQKGTIAIVFVQQALHAVQARGLDADALLRRAGIAPALLRLPQARVSAANYSVLWRLVNEALGDEFFGQDSRPMKVGSFAMLCHSVIHCRSLEHAIARALRFFGLLLDDISAELTREGDTATISLRVKPGAPVRVFAHETMLVLLHGLICWLVGRRVRLRVARFAYAEPKYSVEYQAMFSSHLEFERPLTEIVFDAACLSLPLVQSGESLKAFLRSAPENIVLKYKNEKGVSARVRQRLKSRPLNAWPDFETLCAEMNLAGSTLRRRLLKEGQSYQVLKDELRRDMAIDLLSHSRLNVSEIAIALGFAEPSAFYRAFRKWTGAVPTAYRTADARP